MEKLKTDFFYLCRIKAFPNKLIQFVYLGDVEIGKKTFVKMFDGKREYFINPTDLKVLLPMGPGQFKNGKAVITEEQYAQYPQ